MDTIFALATARGKAGVSIVRISGPKVVWLCEELIGFLPEDRRASLTKLSDLNGSKIDDALVLRFEGPHSFTGEDVLELHLHGSPAVVSRVLLVLSDVEDLRLAEPGEFTRRALENDQISLTEVEGLGDLIEAETEAQRLQAMRVFSGDLGKKCEEWREWLIHAAALLQATIDFADEEVPEDVYPDVRRLLEKVSVGLRREVAGFAASERIRDGFEVAIIGPPNIGKSTLLNRLAGREAALTSSVAGTTRDVIEVRMDICGLPVTILDTAGLREATDQIELAGIALAKARSEKADLRVFLADDSGDDEAIRLNEDDIILIGKADEGQVENGVSGKTGAGIDELLYRISKVLERRASGASLAIRTRHLAAMKDTLGHLEDVESRLGRDGEFIELMAEDLRRAIFSLETLIGRVGVEDVLDRVFASFCLGK